MAERTSDSLRGNLGRIGRFRVLNSGLSAALLKEKGFPPECSDRDCAMRAGKVLGADKVAVGEIGNLGNSFVITVRVIDTRRGLTEYTARALSPAIAEIDPAIRRIAAQVKIQAEGTREGSDFAIDQDISRLMYLCGNFATLGDFISLEKTQGMAAAPGARALVRGVIRLNSGIFIDVVWIDEKAKNQSNGGYLAEIFRLVSRGKAAD